MEAATPSLVQPWQSIFLPPRGLNHQRISTQKPRRSSNSVIRSAVIDKNKDAASSSSHESKTSYNDTWFDRLAINYLSNSLQSAAGMRSSKEGYEGLVEAATMASRKFNPTQQRQVVIQTLETAIPAPILFLIRTIVRPSKFAREYFAAFTTIFCAWLVGPCQVKESVFEGRIEKNVVYIPKCRVLEESNCVGICTNLCKMPSQSFIKDSLGISINMVPNFEDLSCEMRFGEEPPPQSLDPAFSQPCFKQCKIIKRHHDNCAT